MKRRKIKTSYPKSKNAFINAFILVALILVALVIAAIVIPTFFIALKDIITTKAASNNTSGRWISLGMEGVSVGAIAASPNFASDHTLFINSADGIFRSTNAGHTWRKLTNGLPVGNPSYDAYNSSTAISPNYAIDKTIFVNTPPSYNSIPNGLYRSQDDGENWERVDVEFGESVVPQIAFSPNYKNDHTIIIGGDGDIPGDGFLAKSTDNGSSWQTLNLLPDYSYWLISDFAFSPNYVTDQTIFAGITVGDGISNSAGILKSINGGATWDLVIPFNQPGSNTWAVAVSPNFANDHTVLAGTDATNSGYNLIKSIDGGVTWQLASTGLPTTDVQDIVISSDGIVYAGTGGDAAAYISLNFGSRWQPLDDFPDNNICGAFYSLALSPQYVKDGTIFAGCSTPSESVSGIWKHVLSRSPDRDFYLLSPFNNGVTWTVYNGYFDNRDQSKDGCGIENKPLDHCRNQLFGLDLVPDQNNDTAILSPGNGTIGYVGKLEGGCMGVRIILDNGINLNVCHFVFPPNVRTGERVLRGKILGVRSSPHVHLSLDDRYRIGTLCPGQEHCFLPIPFDEQHTLDGMVFNPDPNGETVLLPYPLCDQRKVDCQFEVNFQQYKDTSGISTNVAIP